jgi:CBS domain-containing protein
MALRADDLMSRDVVTTSPGESLADLERLLVSHRIGGVPVLEKGRPVGVVSRSDVIRILATEDALVGVQLDFYREFPGADGPRATHPKLDEAELASEQAAGRLARLRVRDAMTPDVLAVDVGASVQEIARELVQRAVHRLLVTEEERLVGIVSTLDVVRAVSKGTLS